MLFYFCMITFLFVFNNSACGCKSVKQILLLFLESSSTNRIFAIILAESVQAWEDDGHGGRGAARLCSDWVDEVTQIRCLIKHPSKSDTVHRGTVWNKYTAEATTLSSSSSVCSSPTSSCRRDVSNSLSTIDQYREPIYPAQNPRDPRPSWI